MKAAALAILGCLAASCAARAVPVEKPPAPPPVAPSPPAITVDTLIEWLPTDTETLIACRVPFKIEAAKDEDEDEEESDEAMTITTEEIVQSILVGSVATIRKGKFHQLLANSTVKLAIQGSRKFRPPTGLGSLRYEGCDIAVIEGEAALDRVLKAAEDAAEESYLDHDTRVYVFREKLEQDVWTFHLARPKANILLCATHRDYLGEVLLRLGKPEKTRAFPKELPEWKLLEPAAKVWALRHYIRGDENRHAESFQNDPTATGMVFFPSAEGRSARVRFLSQSEHTFEEVNGAFDNPREGSKSKVSHENGIIDVVSDVAEARSITFFFFVLLAYLGHGIFV